MTNRFGECPMKRENRLLRSIIISCLFFTYPVFADSTANTQPTNGLPQSTTVIIKPATNSISTLPLDYEQIRALLKKGELEEAKKSSLQYLTLHPGDVDVQLVLGTVYYKQQHYDDAIKILSDGLKQYPNYADVRLVLIQSKLKQNKYSEALNLADEGLKIDPKNKDLLNEKIKASKLMHHFNHN